MIDTEIASNLTRRQLLIWLEQQLQPGVPANNIALVSHIEGEIDASRFRRAFRSVARRSDALATVFEEVDGLPRQSVIPDFDLEPDFVDLSALADPAAMLRAFVDTRRQRPFVLNERACDAALIRLGPGHVAFYLCQHNLIADAWSSSVVYQRTMDAYLGDDRAELPRFADYVAFERSYQSSPKRELAGRYWKKKLGQGLEPLRFFGHQHASRSPYLDRREITLSLAQVAALQSRARGAHRAFTPTVSMFAVFLSLLFAHLHRLSGNRSLGIGAPVVNRPSKIFRQTIGRFAEIASFRVDIADDETFSSLLEKTSREVFEVLPHAQFSTGNPVHQRAFEASLNFHNATFAPFGGLPTRIELSTGVVGTDGAMPWLWRSPGANPGDALVLNVHDFSGTGDISLSFDFDCDAFAAADRDESVAAFMHLIDRVTCDPDRPINEGGPSARARPDREDTAVAAIFEPPASDVESKLASIWQELLSVERVGRRDNFFALGGHSLLAVRLLHRIRVDLGAAVTLGSLFEQPTIEAIAATISSGHATAGCSIVRLQPGASEVPMFFICGIQLYQELARELGPLTSSFAIFLPVEELLFQANPRGGKRPIIRVEEMAREYLALIRTKQANGPYCLGGLSFGGILAFEIAQQLRDLREKVALLALFDSILPSARRRHLVPWVASHLESMARFEFSRLRRGFVRRRQPSLLGRLRRIGHRRVPVDLGGMSSDELVRLRAEIYTRAAAAYEGRIRPYPGPATLFRALHRPLEPGWTIERLCGWEDIIPGLEVIDVPGDHGSILRAPNVGATARALRADLDAIHPDGAFGQSET